MEVVTFSLKLYSESGLFGVGLTLWIHHPFRVLYTDTIFSFVIVSDLTRQGFWDIRSETLSRSTWDYYK